MARMTLTRHTRSTVPITAGPVGRGHRLAVFALVWVLLYGCVRIYWEVGGEPPRMSPVGTDLVVFTGWGAIALCAAAAVTLALLMTVRPSGLARRGLLGVAWTVGAALVASGALLLLDVIGGLLPGLGVEFFPLGALSKSACVISGVLLARTALVHQRETRAGCASCGRTERSPGPLTKTPGWAWCAAYVSVAGCAVRVIAQACVGFGESPLAGGASATLFEIGFLLGGSLLPLSLVHGWGRVWPRWVPALGGRDVPRRLVLWPATAISGGLVVYFGLMLLQMISERLQGRNPFPPSGGLELPETFFWFAVPAYLVWGAGMAAATFAYQRLTRSPCAECAR